MGSIDLCTALFENQQGPPPHIPAPPPEIGTSWAARPSTTKNIPGFSEFGVVFDNFRGREGSGEVSTCPGKVFGTGGSGWKKLKIYDAVQILKYSGFLLQHV